MDRMGLRTVIILSVFLSSLSVPSSLEYYVDSDSNCLKDNSSFDIEYRCPKENEEISLFISSANEVTLECTNRRRPFVNKEILPKLNLTENTYFELKGCYLNVSFYEILSKFNMNKVKYLAYSPVDSLWDVETTNVTKEMFEHMESIERLNLGYSTMTLSQDFLENTPNLRVLSLNGNRLTQISKYFNHVPKLEALDLSDNQIDFTSDGVFEDLKNLVEFYASENNMTSISRNTFKGLESLKVLWITNNNIKNIEEDSFADMHKLDLININLNNIEEIHKNLFKNIKLLEDISLGYNNISVLPDYLFANLTSLRNINLSFNNLREIPEHIFSNCGKLQYLTLEENHLSIIPDKTFLNLTSLEELDISDNLLETLSDQLFSSLDNLERLYVNNNKLTALGIDIFHKMGKLRTLNLSRNKISFIHLQAFRGLIHPDLSQNQWNNTNDIGEIIPYTVQRSNSIRDYDDIQQIFQVLEFKKIDLSFNLIKDLRNIYSYLGDSWSDLFKFPYFDEMDEILGRKPNIIPKNLASSIKGVQSDSMELASEDVLEDPVEPPKKKRVLSKISSKQNDALTSSLAENNGDTI